MLTIEDAMTTDTGSHYATLVAQACEAASVLSEENSDLRSLAFDRVLQHLLGNGNGQANPATVATAPEKPSPAREPIDSSLATEQQRVAAVARYFDIDPDGVRELFDLDGDEPELVAPSGKLPKGKADAVREIALLIGGVRTALGLETSTQHLREAAEAYKKFAPNHFMDTLCGMKTIAVLGKPNSRNRLVRMRVIGAEAARPLAQRLVADGG